MSVHTAEYPLHGSIQSAGGDFPSAVARRLAAVCVVALAAAAWSSAERVASRDVVERRAAVNVGAGVIASLGARPSHNGRYVAEVVATTNVSEGVMQSWTVHLAGRLHRRVAHAVVSVRPWMPDTDERSPLRAAARYVGNGDYRLEGLCFPRAGWWNVALVIDGRSGVDSVAFNVVLPRTSRMDDSRPRCPGGST